MFVSNRHLTVPGQQAVILGKKNAYIPYGLRHRDICVLFLFDPVLSEELFSGPFLVGAADGDLGPILQDEPVPVQLGDHLDVHPVSFMAAQEIIAVYVRDQRRRAFTVQVLAVNADHLSLSAHLAQV